MEELIFKNREVKENIVSIINNSGLPAFVLKSIIKDCLEQLNELENKEYQEAKQIIETKQQEENKEEKEEE